MKHHKVKGVWAHKPDSLPLGDNPSNGVKRKKNALQKLTKKHLWDKLNQNKKMLVYYCGRSWLYTLTPKWDDVHLSGWVCDVIGWRVDDMDELIKELQGRD